MPSCERPTTVSPPHLTFLPPTWFADLLHWPEHRSYSLIRCSIIPTIAYFAAHFRIRIPTYCAGLVGNFRVPDILDSWDTETSDKVFGLMRSK